MMRKLFLFWCITFLACGNIFQSNAQVAVDWVHMMPVRYSDQAYWSNHYLDYWPPTTNRDTALKMDRAALSGYPFMPIVFAGCDVLMDVIMNWTITEDSARVLELVDVSRGTNGLMPWVLHDDFDGAPYFTVPSKIEIPAGVLQFKVPYSVGQMPLNGLSNNGKFVGVTYHYNNPNTPSLGLTIGTGALLFNRFSYDVVYQKETVMHKAKLELNVREASPFLVFSIDGGYTWKKLTDRITYQEILDLDNVGVIYLKEPFSCWYETYSLRSSGGGNTVPRPVNVPKVSDAILSVPSGTSYVPSMSNFTFTIRPTGENSSKIPVVTTDRTMIPDFEGVYTKQNSDGSYTVTIYQVQTPIKLDINFASGMSIAGIENSNVWSANGQLYIKTILSEQANIYNVSGVLVKSIQTKAGEAIQTNLPSGFYVVKTDSNKAYKVVVK